MGLPWEGVPKTGFTLKGLNSPSDPLNPAERTAIIIIVEQSLEG